MQLNAIAGHRGQALVELGSNDDVAPLQLVRRQRKNLARGVVEVDGFGGKFLAAEQGAQASDGLGSSRVSR